MRKIDFYEKVFKHKGILNSLLLLSLLTIMVPQSALAHKVNIFAYLEGDTVYTESYFPDGKKVEGGLVEVYDSQGNKLLEGKTNKEGQFNFKLPKIDDLKIVINASLGHRNSYNLSKAELQPGITMSKAQRPKLKQKIPLREIIAGIGYIFGIMGIILFFLNRKRKD